MVLKEECSTYISLEKEAPCHAGPHGKNQGLVRRRKQGQGESLSCSLLFGVSTGKTRQDKGNNIGLAILNNSGVFKLQKQFLAAWYLTLG